MPGSLAQPPKLVLSVQQHCSTRVDGGLNFKITLSPNSAPKTRGPGHQEVAGASDLSSSSGDSMGGE